MLGIGDWGLGIGDWGLGIGPNPQSPIPNPQSPIPQSPIPIFERYESKVFDKIFKKYNTILTNKKLFIYIN